MTPKAPRIARAIISAASEPTDRPWILADLDQEFATLATTDPRAASRWYWHQALTSVLPLVRRRTFSPRPASLGIRIEFLQVPKPARRLLSLLLRESGVGNFQPSPLCSS